MRYRTFEPSTYCAAYKAEFQPLTVKLTAVVFIPFFVYFKLSILLVATTKRKSNRLIQQYQPLFYYFLFCVGVLHDSQCHVHQRYLLPYLVYVML